MNEVARTVIGLPRKREEAIEILNRCFSENFIEMDELETRLEKAENARSVEELEELLKDVPAQLLQSGDQQEVPSNSPAKNYSVIMGDKNISAGRLSHGTTIKVIMGNCGLDFRMVKLPPGITEISLKIIMGNCDIIVPPGVVVENETREIMAHVHEDSILSRINKNADKTLRIKGLVVMGSVSIRVE